MKKEDLIAELTSLLRLINDTREKVGLEHDKFQVALSNTLRLLNEGNPILTKMKGSADDIKAYIIRTSTDLRQSSLNPYEQIKVKVESIRGMVQTPEG